jgi:hypothetical protein
MLSYIVAFGEFNTCNSVCPGLAESSLSRSNLYDDVQDVIYKVNALENAGTKSKP